MRGSSSTRSRGRLMTTSLCFRFTELSSTVNFVPAWSVSPRPYPVMLRISRCRGYRRELFNVQRAFGSTSAQRGDAGQAWLHPRSIQTIAVREQSFLAHPDDTQQTLLGDA